MKLIELYRQNEVLWDMSSNLYRRADLKVKALEKIAAEMSMNVEDVKKKIKSLRSTYSAEKAKVDSSKKSGCDAESIYKPSLFWFNHMYFLNSSIVRRRTINNSMESKEDLQPGISGLNTSEDRGSSAVETPSQKRAHQENSVMEGRGSSVTASQKRARTQETNQLDSALNVLLELNKPKDVFESFAENIAAQLRSFPEGVAYKLMVDMQLMANEKKIEHLKEKENIEFQKTSATTSSSTQIVTPEAEETVQIVSNEILKNNYFAPRALTPLSDFDEEGTYVEEFIFE